MQTPAATERRFGKLRFGRTASKVRDPASTAKRNRIVFGAASILTLAGSFFGVIKPEKTKLEETRALAEQQEATVVQLRGQLAHLRNLESKAGELTQQAVRLNEALPVETHLARFILQVQDASNQAKLDWVSATPSPPVPSGASPGLLESSVAMTASGTYSAVQDFLARLESLQRAVKIGSVNISLMGEAGASADSRLNATIDLKMFVAPSAPPLPSEAPPPPASAAPAPDDPPPASAAPAAGSSAPRA